MIKKLKDITIKDMVECCNKQQNESCINCPLFARVCGKLPYYINMNEDLEKEIEL